ncbi:alpha-amylase family glycosyl hydrolase [Edaphobacter aggregans]|nr:alpha-amylase family glycosyl hydrolase [Edaphobacter aggregans]
MIRCSRWLMCGVFGAALVCGLGEAVAQAPRMTKVDPPNWWAEMPKAMLLVQGENLSGARFHVSDARVRVEKTKISANGHWAQLWLSASPVKAETVTITAQANGGTTTLPFTFAARRKSDDGFAGFSSKDVMYLIMTDRFADGDATNNGVGYDRAKPRGWHGGDLRGIAQQLDYLQDLGVTTVWITPVYQNHEDQSYHGYGATDMYAVDEHFGTLEDFKALAAALHKRGMKLVLDTVPNHVGPAHVWVEDSPEPDWFHGTKGNHREAQGDFKPLTDPHAPWLTQRDVTEGWFANVLPDLNQENRAVAQYLTQNAVWWIEQAGLDGLRLDTFPYVGREFWKGFHAEIHGLYPRVTTVGEVFNTDATITSAFAGGVTRNGVDTGLDTPFDYPGYFGLRDVLLHGAPMSKLAEVWRLDALYPHPERLVPFEGNHDTPRFLSEAGATPAKLKLAFAILATMRGMPQIYSGDEIAMRGEEDPDNRRDFPGGFVGGAENAFVNGSRTAEQREMHDWVKGLLDLRRAHDVLQTGEQQVLQTGVDTMVYVRGRNLRWGCASGDGEGRVLVVVNKGDKAEMLDLPMSHTAIAECRKTSAFWGAEGAVEIKGDMLHVVVSPGSVEIIGVN